MSRKANFKDGKKYLLMGRIGMFGPDVYWADKIKDFRVYDLDGIKDGECALFTSIDGNIVRINRNGTKYYT